MLPMCLSSAADATTRPDTGHPQLFRVFFWMVLFGSLLVYGLGIWDIPVLSHNEARRLVVVQEMLAHHSWLLPTKNGLLYLEKPPLFYWSGGLFGMLAGSCPVWVLRLPSALSALGVVWLLFGRLRRHIGAWAALFAAMMLVSSYFFAEMARVAELNMMLALWVFAAMLMYFSYLTENGRHWLYLTYIFLGLAFMTKGPVALLFFVPPVVVYGLWQKNRAALRGLVSWRGWLLFALVAMPWFLYVSLQLNDMPLLAVFTWQVADKVSVAKGDPVYFYPLFLFGAFAPWTLLPVYHPREQLRYLLSTMAGRFFVVAALVPLILFSLIDFKRPKYILPLCPSIAIVLGIALDHVRLRLQQHGKRLGPLLLVGVAGLLMVLNLSYYGWIQPRVLRHRYVVLPKIVHELQTLPKDVPLYYYGKEPIQLIYYLGHPIAELDHQRLLELTSRHESYFLLAEKQNWEMLRQHSLCLQKDYTPYLHRNGRMGLWQGGGRCTPSEAKDNPME